MASTKAGGSSKNLRDSNPKYLGIKISDGGIAKIGQTIVRQRGTKILSGENTRVGKDHTIFAMKDGKVKFGSKRKQNFDGSFKRLKIVSVVTA
jgi:large subunit ribosomal protein L27